MMNIARLYKMSDSALTGVANKLITGANRDVADLILYGWDQDRIDAIETAKVAFADLPDDVELSGMMAEATEAKNLLRKTATDYAMVEILLRVAIKFGETSPTYRRFRADELHTATADGFWMVVKRVVRQGNALLAQLTVQGLTQPILDQLELYGENYNLALLAQDAAIDARDQAVQTRIEAGNTLYKELTELAMVGKRLWLNVNESKYNDYVLYPNQGNGGEPPTAPTQVVESIIASGAVVNLSVTGIDGTETITAENLGTGVLKVYFSALPTDFPDPGMGGVAGGTTESGTVVETGFLAGVREFLNVYNAGPAEGNIRITIVG
jgi:hypothetical protein